MKNRTVEKYESRENTQIPHKNQVVDAGWSFNYFWWEHKAKTKGQIKGYLALRRPSFDSVEKVKIPKIAPILSVSKMSCSYKKKT